MSQIGASLTDLAGRRAAYSPDRIAFADFQDGRRRAFSFQEVDDRARNLALWLCEQGIRPGDRVAALADNGMEQLDCCFACWKVGAVHAPLNGRLAADELRHVLRLIAPKAALVQPQFQELLATALDAAALPHGVQTLTVCDQDGAYDAMVGASVSGMPPLAPEAALRDTAVLLSTGGTTGLPKAVRISHENIAWNTLNTAIHDLRGDDRSLNLLPLFHTGGLLAYTMPLFILGGTTALERKFDPAQALARIAQERITVLLAVPTIYRLLTECAAWEAADLSSLRFCTSGGEALPLELVRRCEREKDLCFKQGFGMTEFGPGAFALAPEDAQRKAGSIGRPNFYVQARIMDGNAECGEEQAGELRLKGPSLSPGYFGPSGQDAGWLDAEGWLHTGDIVHRDREGFHYVVDRKKDMYISGGENIYPAEIERVAQEYPGVHQCAAVGLPDRQWGEAGRLAVVLEPGAAHFSSEALLRFLKRRLAHCKAPKRVHVLPELPTTAAGKILKRKLREILAAEEG